MEMMRSLILCGLLISPLAACGDGEQAVSTATTPAETAFTNAVPLPLLLGDDSFIFQLASGAETITISAENGATVEARYEEENEQTGAAMSVLTFSQEGSSLTLYLPLELEAIPYPVRSWDSLDASVVMVYATVEQGENEFASNLLGTLRVSEVGEGVISGTLYFDATTEDSDLRITVAGDFRSIPYAKE